MSPLTSIKKVLQDNLPLSFKLSLKELLHTTRRTLSRRGAPVDQNLEGMKKYGVTSKKDQHLPCVLVFDERVPSPDRDAGSARMFMILKTLVKWSHVIFIPFNRPQGIEYEEALWRAGIETANIEGFRRHLNKRNVTAAIVSRPSVAGAMIPRIRGINKQIRIVFDMVDVHFLRLEREYAISRDEQVAATAKRYRTIELKLVRASDVTWCATPEERQLLERESKQSTIEAIPTIHPLTDCGKPFEERADLLFVGNFAHRPNTDAVLYFLKEIFPLVRNSLSDVKVRIVGDNAPASIRAYESSDIQILGYVQDLQPLLQTSRIFIAPVRFGAGIKGKIGEAMAGGLPVVTTNIGAEGFGLSHLSNVMIADDSATFAQAVTQLYTESDLWELLARNARRHIEDHFTPEVVAGVIDRSVKGIN